MIIIVMEVNNNNSKGVPASLQPLPKYAVGKHAKITSESVSLF